MLHASPKPLTVPNVDAANIQLVVFDFDGVFTDNAVWVTQNGEESVRCWRSDGLGLKKLREMGLKLWVLSTEANPVVARRCEKLKIPCKHDIANKQEALLQLCKEQGVDIGQTLFMGNDINDAGCLEVAGISVVVQDAYAEVVPLANFQTSRAGGYGAVRELCDWIATCKTAEAEAPLSV